MPVLTQLLFSIQALAALDSSPSRIVTGTTIASSVPAAMPVWWARDSSRMDPTFFARSAPSSASLKVDDDQVVKLRRKGTDGTQGRGI